MAKEEAKPMTAAALKKAMVAAAQTEAGYEAMVKTLTELKFKKKLEDAVATGNKKMVKYYIGACQKEGIKIAKKALITLANENEQAAVAELLAAL